jgi:hypothetical protein
MNQRSEIEAAQIRAQLNVAGEVLPASLRDEAYGVVEDTDAPYLVVESAEGVTTFPGIDETNGERETADDWFTSRYAEIAEQIQPPSEAQRGGQMQHEGAARKLWPFGK